MAMAISVAGCSNHRFNDDDYRPLGESQTVQRSS
ncbi:MAG: type VI secretion protein [Pseudomonas profundi]|nr:MULTISPECIES: type VI secretion protein [Pseudomonas]